MSDLTWVDRMLQSPPSSLSELESIVGRLDVDFAGGEGFGSVLRPRPDPSAPPRGALHPTVRSLYASFFVDLYHGDPYRPRDLRLSGVRIGLTADHGELRRRLEDRFGVGRAFTHDEEELLEYGAWFYLRGGASRPPQLCWEHERPEWALPTVAPTAREKFLSTLVDRLISDHSEPAIAAALAPLAQGAGAEIRSPVRYHDGGQDGISIRFRPGLPVAMVVAAFGWERPVAWSGDVHMASWNVAPLAVASAPPWRLRLGCWQIQVMLDGRPRDAAGATLPDLGRAVPSPLYDLHSCQNAIAAIALYPENDGSTS